MLPKSMGTCAVLRIGINAEHDSDLLVTDFDPPHKTTDDVALYDPIRPVQPILDHRGEHLQLPDDALEGVGLLGGFLQRRRFGLEFSDALTHACEPRFERRFTDHAFGIAVDQSARAAPQLGELPFDALPLGLVRPGAHSLQAPVVFLRHAARLLE